MRIYIASSWKNQHGVEMLTAHLRVIGCEVISWVENNYGESHNHVTKRMDFNTWVTSPESDQSFEFDTHGAGTCDLFIYYGPAGMDAAAECGICYGQRFNGRTIPMLGLWAKSENFGLMRKMVDYWFERVDHLVDWVLKYKLERSEEKATEEAPLPQTPHTPKQMENDVKGMGKNFRRHLNGYTNPTYDEVLAAIAELGVAKHNEIVKHLSKSFDPPCVRRINNQLHVLHQDVRIEKLAGHLWRVMERGLEPPKSPSRKDEPGLEKPLRKISYNDTHSRKTRLAVQLGYKNVPEAMAAMGRYEFEQTYNNQK